MSDKYNGYKGPEILSRESQQSNSNNNNGSGGKRKDDSKFWLWFCIFVAAALIIGNKIL